MRRLSPRVFCSHLSPLTQLAAVDYAAADEVTKTRLKVIGDHIRAVVYLISDGVLPSNIGRGYIARRLIRRVVRNGRLLGISGGEAFTPKVAAMAVALSGACDAQVAKNAGTPACGAVAEQVSHPASLSVRIYGELEREELRFVTTLEKGEALLDELLTAAVGSAVSGERVRTPPSLGNQNDVLLSASSSRRPGFHALRHVWFSARDYAGGCSGASRGR